jgi:hypothetical protein
VNEWKHRSDYKNETSTFYQFGSNFSNNVLLNCSNQNRHIRFNNKSRNNTEHERKLRLKIQMDWCKEGNQFEFNNSISTVKSNASRHDTFDSASGHSGFQTYNRHEKNAAKHQLDDLEIHHAPKRFKCPDGPRTPPYEYLKPKDIYFDSITKQTPEICSEELQYQIPVLISDVNARYNYTQFQNNDHSSSSPQSFRAREIRPLKKINNFHDAAISGKLLGNIDASPFKELDSNFNKSYTPRLKLQKKDYCDSMNEQPVLSSSRLHMTPSPHSEYSYSSRSTIMSYEERLKTYYEKIEKDRQCWEKREQRRTCGKDERKAKRIAKKNKKAFLRQEIQNYIHAGHTIDNDDQKMLSKMRHMKLFENLLKPIDELNVKKSCFSRNTFPAERTLRKEVSLMQKFQSEIGTSNKTQPPPPAGAPPKYLEQPVLKILSQNNLEKLALSFKDLPMDSLGFKVFNFLPAN